MKFILTDPISYDEIWRAVQSYALDTHGDKMPTYLLVHPETRHKLIIKEIEADRGMPYRVIHHVMSPKEEGLRSTERAFDLWIIRSEDVEPGFMILCG